MNDYNFGNLIYELRMKANLTQDELAYKLGLTNKAVSKWETGKNIPDLAIIKQICSDYDISIDELLDGSTKENIKNRKLIGIIIFLILSLRLL